MEGVQLTLWDEPPPQTQTGLDKLLDWSFGVFDSLPDQDYQLAFSGGKDSHVLLGVYLDWRRSRNKSLNVKIVFSDTLLESPQLYRLIDAAKAICDREGIEFIQVQPDIQASFWVKMVGLGYPVPNHRNRWCTQYLKIKPMSAIGAMPITGSHAGESSKRDPRLASCGSSECGIDKIEKKIEAIATWRNCDVWDWIILHADTSLYMGCSQALMNLYDITEGTNGSLRMGCFMCPVVAKERIARQVEDGIIPPFAVEVRKLIEGLRHAPRINSARTKKAGAILVDARIEFWRQLQPYIPVMKQYGWISDEIVQIIEESLVRRAYPPTYTKDWVVQQEPLARAWNGKDDETQLTLFSSPPT